MKKKIVKNSYMRERERDTVVLDALKQLNVVIWIVYFILDLNSKTILKSCTVSILVLKIFTIAFMWEQPHELWNNFSQAIQMKWI